MAAILSQPQCGNRQKSALCLLIELLDTIYRSHTYHDVHTAMFLHKTLLKEIKNQKNNLRHPKNEIETTTNNVCQAVSATE